jgi:small subunit ribosomal protein S20
MPPEAAPCESHLPAKPAVLSFRALLLPASVVRIRASFLQLQEPSVANIKSAEKRAKQNIKRRAANMATRSKFRTAVKGALAAVKAGKKDEAAASVKAAGPVIDSLVNKGLIHRNKAARHKRQLNAQLKALATK